MKINFVSFHMALHAEHSGYSQIVRYLNGGKFDLKDSKSFSRFVPSHIKNKLVVYSASSWFNEDRLATELSVILNMFTERRQIYHFIYGENSYHYSGWFSRLRGHKIICTYHLPPSIFPNEVKSIEHIRRLDAILVVANNQIDFFAQFIPRKRIFFIPHGIDTNYFQPKVSFLRKRDKICLFVGNYLRDFKTLAEVIRIVQLKDNSVKFVIITQPEHFEHLKDMKVTLRTNLTDAELLLYYQKATIYLQPMRDCTANNSILEALSCGLPVIATDIGGIRDYVDESCAILTPPGNAHAMAYEILRLIDDKQTLVEMGENARQKALQFDWCKIAMKARQVYEKINAQIECESVLTRLKLMVSIFRKITNMIPVLLPLSLYRLKLKKGFQIWQVLRRIVCFKIRNTLRKRRKKRGEKINR